MSNLLMYDITLTKHFKKQLRKLSKKDPQIQEALSYTLLGFSTETAIYLGKGLFKLRMRSPGKGKSGGYRVCILLLQRKNLISPIAIFPKSQQENIGQKELTYHLRAVKQELVQMF